MGSTVSAEMMGFVLLSVTSDNSLLSLTSDYSLEKAVGISSVPKFPCVNTPSLVEAEGAVKLFYEKGPGFDYLRTSRDC